MSFTRTIDLFCDKCGRWKHGETGWGSGVLKSIWTFYKKEGWERHKEDGSFIHICPVCLGKISQYYDYFTREG